MRRLRRAPVQNTGAQTSRIHKPTTLVSFGLPVPLSPHGRAHDMVARRSRSNLGRKASGSGRQHDPDRHGHGCLHAEHPARQSGRSLCIRRDRSLARHLVWPVRGPGRNARASFHVQRACSSFGNHRLWRHRLYAASVAPPRSSRLPQHVPQDRRHCRARDRHLSGPARSEDGGGDPFRRR